MKRCPECGREYDSSMMFCLDDGAELLYGPASGEAVLPALDESTTAILHSTDAPGNAATLNFSRTTDRSVALPGDQTRSPARSGSSRNLIVAVAGGVLLFATLGIGGYLFYSRSAGSKQIESIAVMPFVNDGGNPDGDYLSDGMTETLINSLSQIPNLSVKARSSVFRYKGKEVDPKKVAAELGVQAILTGRVIQRGDQLTLSVELIDGLTENTIWGNKYERKGSDLVSLQSEVARDVSGKLKSKISGADAAKVEKTFTANPEAYQLYLKGNYYWNKRTADNLKKSIEYFNQAIEKDPGYGQAYAGMALAYVLLPEYFGGTVEDSLSKGTAAARRALELDSSLAEAHAALGLALADDLKFAESNQELQQAIKLNPNYATAHQWYANNLTVTKKFDEGIAEGRRAQELDPLSLIVNENLAEFYYYAGQYDKALEQEKATIALDPTFFLPHLGAGQAYEMKGMYPEALAEYKQLQELNDDPNYYLSAIGHLYAVTGKREEALRVLTQLKEMSNKRRVAGYNFAIIYAALDDKDKAIEFLEKDHQVKESIFKYVAVDPFFKGLHSDPRFIDLMRRAGFPD
ncbi:MAG: TPR end-of-group domain-containing protein [Pyrinomonadaceae bacterium]